MQQNQGYSSTVGFMLCTKGSLSARCFGNDFVMSEGMLCFFSPIISVSTISKSPDCEIVKYDIPITSVFPLLSKIVRYLQQLNIDTKPFINLTSEQQTSILAQLNELQREKEALDGTESPLLRILAEQNIYILEQRLMISAMRIFAGLAPMSNEEPPNVTRKVALQFMLLLAVHFKKHRTVEFYASNLNLSASYFTRLFKRQTGSTPMEIIHTITCTESRHLLEKTDLSIKEIAAELGFPEQFTFRKYFKTHTGMSPTEYRRYANAGPPKVDRTEQ